MKKGSIAPAGGGKLNPSVADASAVTVKRKEPFTAVDDGAVKARNVTVAEPPAEPPAVEPPALRPPAVPPPAPPSGFVGMGLHEKAVAVSTHSETFVYFGISTPRQKIQAPAGARQDVKGRVARNPSDEAPSVATDCGKR
jgi:hypothetical protein